MNSDGKGWNWKEIALFLAISIPACVLAYWIIYTVDAPPFTWLKWLAKDDTEGLTLALFFGVPAGIIFLIWLGLRALISRKKEHNPKQE